MRPPAGLETAKEGAEQGPSLAIEETEHAKHAKEPQRLHMPITWIT